MRRCSGSCARSATSGGRSPPGRPSRPRGRTRVETACKLRISSGRSEPGRADCHTAARLETARMGAFSMTGPGRTRAIAAIVLALLVAFGALGCGGSDRLSKSDYEAQVKAVGSDLKESLTGFQGNQQNLGQLETKVGQAQVKLNDAASKLKKLKPPKDAQ